MNSTDKMKIAEICLDISASLNKLAAILVDDVRKETNVETSEAGEADGLDLIQDTVSESQDTVEEKGVNNADGFDTVDKDKNVLEKIIKDNLILNDSKDNAGDSVEESVSDAVKTDDNTFSDSDKNLDESDVVDKKQESEEVAENHGNFNVPFVDSGDTYVVTHIDKISKHKYNMRIVVSSASTCKILAGSFIYSELKGSKIPKNAVNLLETIKTSIKITPFEDGRILRIDQDIADVNVATASTLFFGRSESSRVFKNEETGEYYEPTRNKTPQTTSELESYIFNNT